MNIDSIENGTVIDHISAGRGLKLYELLGLSTVEAPVAIMLGVSSRKLGRKDIIKIDARVPVDTDVIGFFDPGATVNVIRDGVLVEKRTIGMPERLVNVIRCENPRCITSCEQELDHVFRLTERGEYRCVYCDTKAKIR